MARRRPALHWLRPSSRTASATAVGYLVAFDSAGDIRWYHAFPGVWPIEAKQLRNGHISVYAGRSFGWQAADGQFRELATNRRDRPHIFGRGRSLYGST